MTRLSDTEHKQIFCIKLCKETDSIDFILSESHHFEENNLYSIMLSDILSIQMKSSEISIHLFLNIVISLQCDHKELTEIFYYELMSIMNSKRFEKIQSSISRSTYNF
jgi:hypothetical protein